MNKDTYRVFRQRVNGQDWMYRTFMDGIDEQDSLDGLASEIAAHHKKEFSVRDGIEIQNDPEIGTGGVVHMGDKIVQNAPLTEDQLYELITLEQAIEMQTASRSP